MPIVGISIQNYKSLRSVSITPVPLSVIVGANASGKSNFADCLDFISEVYRHGLEVAISRKGGYENIAFRRQQRSKLPITIHLATELTPDDIGRLMSLVDKRYAPELRNRPKLRIEHTFGFVASNTSIRSQFKITHEVLTVSEWVDKTWERVVTMNREGREVALKWRTSPRHAGGSRNAHRTLVDMFWDFSELEFYGRRGREFSPTELIVPEVSRFASGLMPFIRVARAIKVFQINPMRSREVGVSMPSPELERSGGNLPAVVDEIKKNKPDAWTSVLEVIRAILPNLKDIEVDYTPSKRLGLFFREYGYRRPWNVEEVSDGTVQTLALLVAIFDPGSSLLVLEELENSVHPWIIRRVLDACRQASESKQIILTTHSPIVINDVAPEEVWVIWRDNGESHLEQLPKLNQELLGMWVKGDISTFEYIDSGALPLAIPPAPSDDQTSVIAG